MGEGGPGASQELTSVRECVDAPVAVAVPRGLTSAERASWFAAEGIDLGSAAYRFVEEPRPVVSNRVEVARRLLEAYPAVLRDRKVEGRVDVGLLVSAAGRVDRAVIVRSAGSGVLDEAALDVARIIRFRPLVLAGCRVAFWIGLPIAFGTR